MKHFGVNEGLPSSECYAVFQDSLGYIWFASDGGVSRFDGYKFVTYTTTNGLPDNTIFHICEDNHKRIWFTSYSNKLSYYDYKTDAIHQLKINEELSKGVRGIFQSFNFDSKDVLYLATQYQGYYKIKPPYNKLGAINHKFSSFYIKELDNHKIIFSFLANEKIKNSRIHLQTLHFLKKSYCLNYGMNTARYHCTKLSDETYFHTQGLKLLKIDKNRTTELLNLDIAKKPSIITVSADSEDRLWVNYFKKGTSVFLKNKYQAPYREFLKDLSVTCVLEDAEKGIWISTLDEGVFYIPNLNFSYYNKTINKVLSIEELNDKIYLLTPKSIDVFDHFKNKVSTVYNVQEEVTPLSFFKNRNNELIISGTSPFIYNPSEKGKSRVKFIGENMLPVRLRNIISLNDDTDIGYTTMRLYKINKKKNYIEEICVLPSLIYSLTKVGNDVWISTQNGSFTLDKSLKLKAHKEVKFFDERIEDIAKVGETLIFATRGHGIFYFKNGKVLKNITERDGLSSNLCKKVKVDSDGVVWVATNKGLSVIKETKGRTNVIALNTNNGLIDNEVNNFLIYNDTLHIATNNGVSTIARNDVLLPKPYNIPVTIEKFIVNKVQKDFTLKHNLNHNQNFIQINYKGLYMKGNGKVNYIYKLEGLEDSWNTTTNTFVQFTTLPPGKYKFIVYALTNNGEKSKIPGIINFTIKKPFWETWWFYSILFGTMSLSLFLVYRNRIKRVTKIEREKAELNKRIYESELKALRSQMNPHFMFNAINSIQNFVIKNDTVSAQKYLTKFARLIRHVLENSKYEYVLLSNEIEMLNLYVGLEALRASFSFDYDITVDEAVNAELTFIPPMIIQPFIENAILHGIIPLTERRGKLLISFVNENTILKCIVEDNGIGREAAHQIKLKKQLSHKSMGMSVTQERMKLLGRQNDKFSAKVEIEDKFDEGKPVGTIVKIVIDLKK
ncbi:MAG: histidine kinase [Limnohabitans sp.]|nr:histidine kinase [Limnohabitans sp.]